MYVYHAVICNENAFVFGIWQRLMCSSKRAEQPLENAFSKWLWIASKGNIRYFFFFGFYENYTLVVHIKRERKHFISYTFNSDLKLWSISKRSLVSKWMSGFKMQYNHVGNFDWNEKSFSKFMISNNFIYSILYFDLSLKSNQWFRKINR